jgi:hypothetical protein
VTAAAIKETFDFIVILVLSLPVPEKSWDDPEKRYERRKTIIPRRNQMEFRIKKSIN